MDRLDGWSRYCRAEMPRQAASIEALASLPDAFSTILPANGRRAHWADAESAKAAVAAAGASFVQNGRSFF